MTVDPLKTIAAGGNPVWEQTYKHPVHGDLTFRGALPTADKLTEQSIMADYLADQAAERLSAATGTSISVENLSGDSALLVAAIAGVATLLELPVLREDRIEDPDRPEHVRIDRVRYNPREEQFEAFLVRVWVDYATWRVGMIERVDELGKSSGVTTGQDSNGESSEPTESPITTSV